MDLFRLMQAFVQTVEQGSMSAAARTLDVSPAMVGQYIAALEARFGTRLLNRTTRSQKLTDFGESCFEQCKDILDRVSLADLEAEVQQCEAVGKLRITAPTTFGATVLMPALTRYRQLSPRVKVDIELTDRNVDMIEEGFDVAFRIGVPPDSRLIARKLMPYKMTMCAAPCYLSQRGKPEHPRELANHEMISFTPSSGSILKMFKGEETFEVTPENAVTVNSGYALLNAANAGLGIIVQPNILLDEAIKEGKLIPLFTDWSLGERQISLLYYRDARMTPRLRSFVSYTLSEFKKGF
ncbi:MAG: DNA-binding transcriptional LysR family regulator [Oceanospirillaceae bacterium]|jgi:DNA-binding transcriptional LysR family regulator